MPPAYTGLRALARLGAAGLCLLMMLAALQAQAADITYETGKVNVIAISGTIARDDADKFAHVVPDPLKKTGVLLASPGGDIVAALMIGEAIHHLGYATLVPDGQVCASACGLIWLGGNTRMVSETARIGFHAAYVGHGETTSESGVGNAMIGAYLTRLGLSYKAVAFLTSAAPNDMQWLHPDQARAIGIDFVTLPADPSPEIWSTPSRIAARPASEPAHLAPSHLPLPAVTTEPPTVEAQASNSVVQWFRLWSTTKTDLNALAPYYPDTVNYYGGRIPRAKVLLEKQKFAARWPVRAYNIRAGSVSVTCAATCIVNGIVDWNVSSPERRERSIGAANFTLELPKGMLLILGENGSVITTHKEVLGSPETTAAVAAGQPSSEQPSSNPTTPDTSEPAAASTSQAFNEGRAARLDYEQWFNSITDADYKGGVTFWAANRSSKPPPSCRINAGNQPWYTGCTAAQARLNPIDIRRKTENDFRAGWNSL